MTTRGRQYNMIRTQQIGPDRWIIGWFPGIFDGPATAKRALRMGPRAMTLLAKLGERPVTGADLDELSATSERVQA